MRIELADGKITYVCENGEQYFLRKGIVWGGYSNDVFVRAMAQEIERLREYEFMYKGLED